MWRIPVKRIYAPNVWWCDGKFLESKLLESISLPKLTRYEGGGTFYNCSSLKDAHLGEADVILNKVFQRCNMLEEFYSPYVKSVGDYAFATCYKIKSIYLPKLEKIGGNALNSCRSLEMLAIGTESSTFKLTNKGATLFTYTNLANVTLVTGANNGTIVENSADGTWSWTVTMEPAKGSETETTHTFSGFKEIILVE